MSVMPLEKVNTSVVGSSFGPKIDGMTIRQVAIMKLAKENNGEVNGVQVQLRPEDNNEFDKDALGVWARLSSGWVQLGYVNNRDRYCHGCQTSYELKKGQAVPEQCAQCGGALERRGLASILRDAMRQGFSYLAYCTGIYGGKEEFGKDGKPKAYGCNIRIERGPKVA